MQEFQYTTKVRLSLKVLEYLIPELKSIYDRIGTRETSLGRSAFSQWNNIQKFYERVNIHGSDRYPVLDVVGSSKGGTARIYFKPSVTSMARPFRKSVIPLNPDNEFAYFDLKAAEFFLNCVFAGEQEAIDAYQSGEDIYMHFEYIFPPATPRKVIKEILIAQMYNVSPYTVSQKLGISDTQAEYLLMTVSRALPKMTKLKREIIAYDKAHKGYFCPRGLDRQDMVKIASINPAKGFSDNYALSCYTQSALGFFMQKLTTDILPKVNGTLLSVFDSMFIEINPDSKDRLESWLKNHLSPFRFGQLTYGKTLYEAAYGNK